ncbi:MAG: hypothetical protein RIT43_1702, partial [Bacteroidota bacterium]
MKGFLCIVLFLSGLVARAQYPSFFQYSVENGSPSNEIYWLYEDYDGYLWIGCDAGLFKFNGVSYEQISSSELTSRAVTGIIQSKRTGRIYAYNFNRQLICIEKNKLRVIKTWNRPINGLADDHKGNIFITSSEGTFKMEESNFSIDEVHSKLHFHDSKGRTFSSHGISDPSGVVYYQSGNRLMIWQNGIPKALPLGTNSENSIVFFSRFSRHPFVVSFTGGQVMRIVNKNLIPYSDAPLTKALKGRKINCVFESRDGKVWIGTYSGLVCHDPKKKSTEIFYTQFSFSYGIEDSEGNLWFSTLHNGFIRVANLNVRYWTTRDRFGLPDQYNLISFDERSIYFGSTNGMLGKLNVESLEFQKKEHSPKADFGMLYADTIDKCLYFNKNGQIFRFQKERFQLVNKSGRPVKSLFHSPSGYFFLSSQGLFFASSVNDHLTEDRMIDRVW